MSLSFKLTYLCNTYHMYNESYEHFGTLLYQVLGEKGGYNGQGVKQNVYYYK